MSPERLHRDARRADLATIHIAQKALGWDDDKYRDTMFAVCQVRSSAQMSFNGRKRFLAHLRECQREMGIETRPAAPRVAWSPPMRALWSLWQRLADAKLVHQRDGAALRAWVKRQTGVDRPEWLTTQQLDAVIASAKRRLARGGGGPAAKVLAAAPAQAADDRSAGGGA